MYGIDLNGNKVPRPRLPMTPARHPPVVGHLRSIRKHENVPPVTILAHSHMSHSHCFRWLQSAKVELYFDGRSFIIEGRLKPTDDPDALRLCLKPNPEQSNLIQSGHERRVCFLSSTLISEEE